MPRLPQIDDGASIIQREFLDATRQQLGRIPNLYRAMVNGPAALSGYLAFHRALAGSLTPRLREQIALVVADANECTYCIAAHTFRGSRIGLTPHELSANRSGTSDDKPTAAALTFARRVVERQGKVLDADLDGVRAAGFSDGDIAEIVGLVALNTYSNWFNHVAQPDLDFPPTP